METGFHAYTVRLVPRSLGPFEPGFPVNAGDTSPSSRVWHAGRVTGCIPYQETNHHAISQREQLAAVRNRIG